VGRQQAIARIGREKEEDNSAVGGCGRLFLCNRPTVLFWKFVAQNDIFGEQSKNLEHF
jgi:hypothetical protein